jgi:hypothetical protein
MNKHNELYKDKHYDILRDKFKFKKISDNEWYRKYVGNEYYFTYMYGTLSGNYGTIVLSIKDFKDNITKYTFYDDEEFNAMLVKLFPAECRFEKLKGML